jgi:hypothetical protein
MKTTTLAFILLAITVLPLRAQWNTQIVDNSGNVGRDSDIALDSQGHPHIVYWDASEADAKYATWTDNGWMISTLYNGSTGNGRYSSIAIDPEDGIHTLYYSDYGNNLGYKYKSSSGGWIGDYVNSNTTVYWTSICVTYDSLWDTYIPHVAWDNGSLQYAYLDPETGDWLSTIVDDAANVGDFCDIIATDNGEIYISYQDGSDKDLKFAYYDGSEWSTFIVDGIDSDVGYYTSIALDDNGIPHISYYDADNDDLKYATLNLTRGSEAGNSSESPNTERSPKPTGRR